jgi:membrane complex biogenesis BtpA family protein
LFSAKLFSRVYCLRKKRMTTFKDVVGKKKLFIGMLHLGIMPGTPFYQEGTYETTLAAAVEDAVALDRGGASGCLIQTVDRVYTTKDDADPARVAGVANIVREIRKATSPDFLVGVQIMRNAVKASIGVAKVCGGSFVRVGALVGATISMHGLVDSSAHDVMAYRRYIGAEDIGVIADIESMHFHWPGGKPIGEIAWDAKYVGASAVAIGDKDESKMLEMIAQIRKAQPGLPILLAGYTNHANAAIMMAAADGAFVGTCLEKGGWAGRIDEQRVREYAEIVAKL